MCSFDFDELQMDARREYLMKGLKRRCLCKRKRRAKKITERKPQCKIHGKNKFSFDSLSDGKKKKDSFDEPGSSKGQDDIEDIHGNDVKEKDFKSFTKLADFHTDQRKNYDASYSNKKEKPKLDNNETVNKDDDSVDLDHVCADLLKNNIEQIKTELSTTKEKSHCIKPQRVHFRNIYKRNKSKCAKKKKKKKKRNNSENDLEANAESKPIVSSSSLKQNRISRENTSDKPDASEETEDIKVYQSKDAESKYKSQRKKPDIDESADDIEYSGRKETEEGEEDEPVSRKKVEYSKRKVTEEEDELVGKKKVEYSKRKETEEEDEPVGKKKVEYSKRKETEEEDEPVSKKKVEYSKRKETEEEDEPVSKNKVEYSKRKETEEADEPVSKNKLEKCTCKRQKPKISPECARFLNEIRKKQSKTNSSIISGRSLSGPSSSVSFEYARKVNDIKDLECKCPKSNSKSSLDCKALLAAMKKKREEKSLSDLSCCTCEEAPKFENSRRKRRTSPSSECERFLKERKKKTRPKLSPSCSKLLKSRKKKKFSSACEKLLKKAREKSSSCCPCKKPSNVHKKKKKRRRSLSSECKSLLNADRKKKSVSICTCNLPRRSRSKRKSYHTPVLEDCEKELKKMKRALSTKIQQKESQLLGSCKKERHEKSIRSKPQESQITKCRCATSDLKDRYTRMIEDYHRLKRQYDALKCTNALIEKKLRCFMQKSKCKCTK